MQGMLQKSETRASLGLPQKSSSTPALGTGTRPGSCVLCGERIRVMIFRGTGVCSEQHDKARKKNKG